MFIVYFFIVYCLLIYCFLLSAFCFCLLFFVYCVTSFMKKIKTISFYLLMIAIILLAGFYRDFVFKSINALLQAWDHDLDYEMPAGLRFFRNYNYDTIVNFKWLLTLLFSLFYLLIAVAVVRFMFRSRRFVLITVGAYAGILFLSAVFIGIGLVFKANPEKMYEFARYFMGMAQSPVVLMVLIPAFKLAGKENQDAASKVKKN